MLHVFCTFGSLHVLGGVAPRGLWKCGIVGTAGTYGVAARSGDFAARNWWLDTRARVTTPWLAHKQGLISQVMDFFQFSFSFACYGKCLNIWLLAM